MPYYHICSTCGATLDPGEKCDCRDLEALREKVMTAVLALPQDKQQLVLEFARAQQAKRKAPCVPADQSTTQRA